MTLAHALHGLQTATTQLSAAVADLVLTTQEDRPAGAEASAVDGVAEQVSELQCSVATAHRQTAAVVERPASLPATLPAVDDALADAALTYWRGLRSYAATSALRDHARRSGADWRAWQAALEQAQQRTEQPLVDALAAVRAVWRELAEEREVR